MRRFSVIVLMGFLVIAAAGARPVTGWLGAGGAATVAVAVAAEASTPTPTLGSTPQTGVNPPGDNDGDPQDFNGVPYLLLAFVLIVVILAIGVSIFLWRRRRTPSRH